MQGGGRTLLGFTHVKGAVGEGNFDAPLIEYLLQPAIKLTFSGPLF